MTKIIQQDSLEFIGIEARTNNALEASGNGVIPILWERFIKENTLQQIPNRANDSIIAAYTDYASDKDGDYTFFIGARVTSIAEAPTGTVVKKAIAGNYLSLETDKGPVWKVVFELWQKIWKSEYKRAYNFDFEIYDERAKNPEEAIVEVRVGLI